MAPDGADRRVEGWIGSDRHRSSEARRRSDDAGQVRSGIGFSLLGRPDPDEPASTAVVVTERNRSWPITTVSVQ
jgi:hypothetical protein